RVEQRAQIVQHIGIIRLQPYTGSVRVFCSLELIGQMVRNSEAIVDSGVALRSRNLFIGIGSFYILLLIELLVPRRRLSKGVCGEEKQKNQYSPHKDFLGPDSTAMSPAIPALCHEVRRRARTRIFSQLRGFLPRVSQ